MRRRNQFFKLMRRAKGTREYDGKVQRWELFLFILLVGVFAVWSKLRLQECACLAVTLGVPAFFAADWIWNRGMKWTRWLLEKSPYVIVALAVLAFYRVVVPGAKMEMGRGMAYFCCFMLILLIFMRGVKVSSWILGQEGKGAGRLGLMIVNLPLLYVVLAEGSSSMQGTRLEQYFHLVFLLGAYLVFELELLAMCWQRRRSGGER